MKCECDQKFWRVAENPLPGGMLHRQVNCLECGSGWAEVVAAEPVANEAEE
jgi:hypothetical protein